MGLLKNKDAFVTTDTILNYQQFFTPNNNEKLQIDFGKKDIIVPDNIPKNQTSQFRSSYYSLALTYAELQRQIQRLTNHRNRLQEKYDNVVETGHLLTSYAKSNKRPGNDFMVKQNKTMEAEIKDKIDLIDKILNNTSQVITNLKPNTDLLQVMQTCFPQESLNKLDEHRDYWLLRALVDFGKILLLALTPLALVSSIATVAIGFFCCTFLSENTEKFIYNYGLYPLAKYQRDGHYFSLGKTTSRELTDNVQSAVNDVINAINHIPVLQS